MLSFELQQRKAKFEREQEERKKKALAQLAKEKAEQERCDALRHRRLRVHTICARERRFRLSSVCTTVARSLACEMLLWPSETHQNYLAYTSCVQGPEDTQGA